MLSEREKSELRYLAKHGPMWHGVRAAKERGELLSDTDIPRWLELGLIDRQGDGYGITKKGRIECGADLPRCPTCGREF